jgi:hypothetical protein
MNRTMTRLTRNEIGGLLQIGLGQLMGLAGLILVGVMGGLMHVVLQLGPISISQFLVLAGTGLILTPVGTWWFLLTSELSVPSWRRLYNSRKGIYLGWGGTIVGATLSIVLQPLLLMLFPQLSFGVIAILALAISVGGRVGTLGNVLSTPMQARNQRQGSVWGLVGAVLICVALVAAVILYLAWPGMSLGLGHGYQGPLPLGPLADEHVQSVALGASIGALVGGTLDALIVQTRAFTELPRGKWEWTETMVIIASSTALVLTAYLAAFSLGNAWALPYQVWGSEVQHLMLTLFSTIPLVGINNVVKVGILNLILRLLRKQPRKD